MGRSHSPKHLSVRKASDDVTADRSQSPKQRQDRKSSDCPAESGLTPVPPSEPRRGPGRPREAVDSKIEEGKIAMKLREEVANARNDHSEVSTRSSPDAGEGEKRVIASG